MRGNLTKALLAVAVLVVVGIAGLYLLTGRSSAAATQPIAFSHKNHNITRQIACEYCHTNAQVGYIAQIPPVETCYGCHRTVGTASTDPFIKSETQKIRNAYEQNQPILWNRLWFVPEHVVFAHQPHITSGVQCLDCHAQNNPPEMWFQSYRPGMAWCITCHAGHGAGTDCWTCHK